MKMIGLNGLSVIKKYASAASLSRGIKKAGCRNGGRFVSSSGGSGTVDPAEDKSVLSSASHVSKIASQPTHQTHPHLLLKDEITVGISSEEYKIRRYKIMESLCKQDSNHHVLLLPAMPKRYMIEKIPFFYRQNTDFLYFSGCLEPDCVLLVHTIPSETSDTPNEYKSVMFCPTTSLSQVIWDGPRTAFYDASKIWGVDEGMPLSELTDYLSSLEKSLHSPTLWYHHHDTRNNNPTHKSILYWISEGRMAGLESPRSHIHRIRLIKSKAEQKLMRKACRESAEAIRSTISWTQPGMSEHELFAKVTFENLVRGASHLAYPPVIAGGDRANVIHYSNNDQIVQDGEMVLMDAGGEFNGYSGDVTRTWPINGRFSAAQREVYDVVLHVQKTVINSLSQLKPSLDQLYRIMCNEIADVLPQFGIVSSSLDKEERMKAALALCPHHVSHYLGMDVHDTPSIARHEPVITGSVITVEPGLYIPHGCRFVPAKYHGIGVRIEDDLLITEDGCENLSSNCPYEPEEIEALAKNTKPSVS